MKTKVTVGTLHDEHDNPITDKNQTVEIFSIIISHQSSLKNF